jgi:uncharacterized protein YlxW (UPF0749 family)
MSRRSFSRVGLTLLLLVVGVMIVAQMRTERHLRVVSYDRDEQAILLSELVDANLRLRQEIELLESELAVQQDVGRSTALEEVVAELNRVRVLNGLVEVSGPGIEMVIDAPLSPLDLQDLMNESRNSGAEAIALNDHRIVVNSVFIAGERGSVVLDGQAIRRPYRLQAIGDPDTIETALLRPGGLVSMLQRAYPNLIVSSTRQPRIVLSVYRHPSPIRYAGPIE